MQNNYSTTTSNNNAPKQPLRHSLPHVDNSSNSNPHVRTASGRAQGSYNTNNQSTAATAGNGSTSTMSNSQRRQEDNEILKVEIPRWKSKHVEYGRTHHMVSATSPMVASGGGIRSWTGKGTDGGRMSSSSAGNVISGRPNTSSSSSSSPAEGKRYTVFQVYVHYQNGRVTMLEKRYSHFRELHKTLRHKYAAVSKMYFPPKKFFMSLSLHVIEQRREGIENYMNAVLTLRPRPAELA
uniref:PX domain-containing protein n=1 Tax=Globisporangium ultimum (strain ATCC 200006 / CBS 805.95 / DAOM BR144) TaxID=431595 RepID=K3WQ86_GLOUD